MLEMKNDCQYKVSNYNMLFKNKENDKYVWNSISDIIQLISDREYQCLSCKSCNGISKERIGQFLREGFIVPYYVDETEEVYRACQMHSKVSFPHYRILTTTGCNAKCEYCYEKGTKKYIMSQEISLKTASFIKKNSISNKIVLEWFGGEPLMNVKAINTICEQLKMYGVDFKSVMETNGSLFSDDIIDYASKLWNLKSVQITLDGVGKQHDKMKHLKKGSFEKIISNIHKLLKVGMKVTIRLNHDGDMKKQIETISFLQKEFSNISEKPMVYISPLYKSGQCYERELMMQIIELNRSLIEAKFVKKENIYNFKHQSGRCFASSYNGYTIAPNGLIYNCSHNLAQGQEVGNVFDEVDINKRTEFVERKRTKVCEECVLFPVCQGGCRVAELQLAPMTQCHIYKEVIRETLLERLNLL